MKTKKNKRKNILKTGIFLLVTSFLLWNCEVQEDIQIEDQTPNNFLYKTVSSDEISNFKESYNFASKSSIENKLNLKLDFSKIQKQKIKNTDEFTTIIPAKTKYKNINSKVILISQNNNMVKVLISLIPDKKTSSEKFNGILSINHLNGDFINAYRLENGIFKTRFIKRIKKKSTLLFRAPEPDCDENEAPGIFCDNQLDEVVIGSGSSSSYTITSPIPPGPGKTDFSYYDFESDTGGGGGTGNFSGSSTNVNVFPCNDSVHGCQKTPCDDGNGFQDYYGNCVEDDIIDNTNNPCVSNIIKTLQEKDMRGALVPDLVGKTHLSQMILDLFGECKNYDLIIDIKELGNNSQGHPINAQTNGIESITLDDDLVRQATQLSIAKTLIHESLHAYINLKTNRNNIDKDFYDAVKAYYDKFKTPNLSQHNFMAQFVEALAYSLSAYDFHKQDMSYYKAMSWGGLESSDAYQKLDSDSIKLKKKQDAIQKIIKNERYTEKGAKSTKCDK